MRVVVTGAGGLTGRELTIRLLRSGDWIIAVLRNPTSSQQLPAGVEVVIADCLDVPKMEHVLRGADAFVHVAGVHLAPSLARLPALREIPRVVVVSTAAIHSRHRASIHVYREGEAALQRVRPDALIVRPTMIYGSDRDRNVHHVVNFAKRYRFLPLFGDGTGLLQPIHFEDLSMSLVRLLRGGATGVVEAGGREPLTIRAAAEHIFAELGLPTRLLRVPIGSATALGRVADHLAGTRIAEKIQRVLEDRIVDNHELIRLTGFAPRGFPDGVKQEIALLRNSGRR